MTLKCENHIHTLMLCDTINHNGQYIYLKNDEETVIERERQEERFSHMEMVLDVSKNCFGNSSIVTNGNKLYVCFKQ